MPAMFEKYGDSKDMVRGAALKLARRLMGACSPGAVLGLAPTGTSHSNWRVREEVLNTTIMVRARGHRRVPAFVCL